MMSELSKLEEAALKRKERLQSLKRKREDNKTEDEKTQNRNEPNSLPTPKFRSYRPQDKRLGEHVLGKNTGSDVRDQVKELLDLAKNDRVIDQVDISNLAPRQPDWDLKRDVEKKLEKLARRTQKAMAELIREKLKEKQDLAELTTADVN